MRVLSLIPDCLVKPMGGMGEQARNVIDAMPQVDFCVVGSANQPRGTGTNWQYIPVEVLGSSMGNGEALGHNLVMQTAFFAAAVKQPKPDVVHAFDWSSFDAGVYTARHFGVPLVATVQLSLRLMLDDKVVAVPTPHLELVNQNIAMEMRGLAQANAVIQVSQSYANRFAFVDPSKTTVIHNGIDMQLWEDPQPVQLPGSNPFKLVYIGRMDPMKNLTTLLEAELPSNVDLIIIGRDTGGIPSISKKVHEANDTRDNVYYVGPKFGQDKINWLAAADAVIVPSTHEPFGIVALEALASRSLLLTSFAGGMREFVPADVGIPCGTTTETISSAIRAATQLNPAEVDRRHTMGVGVCKQLSWKHAASKVHNIYAKVIKEYNDAQHNTGRSKQCGCTPAAGVHAAGTQAQGAGTC